LAGIPASGSANGGIIMKALNCPKGHGPMEQKRLKKQKMFKGVGIEYMADAFICPECGLEAGTVQSAGDVQRAIADAYRTRVGFLTSQEIKSLRETRGLTQQQLAEVMNVGIASIKRWETGMIQSKSMDHALRMQLQYSCRTDNYTGNREISLPRIKLIAKTFEKILEKRLLKSGDKFLFLAKYLWYADMLAFRQLGKGLTGASYAAITYGPQLNNYRDLVKPIKESDVNDAEALSREEERIIQRVAEKFPNEQEVYDAAHREKIWIESDTGALIPYSCANELTEI
jgi:putative zinc finger/helix-turn-helix YgiT family protein